MAQHITSIPELLDAQEQGLTPDAGDIVHVDGDSKKCYPMVGTYV